MNYLYEFRVRRIKRSFAHESRALMGPEDASRFLAAHASDLAVEHFFAIHLDVRGKMTGFEQIAVGGLASVEVHPREVFRGAILSGAYSIIVGHNHPSGEVTPSDEDIVLADRLIAAGRIVGIEVLDSIVVANGQFYSMVANMDIIQGRGEDLGLGEEDRE